MIRETGSIIDIDSSASNVILIHYDIVTVFNSFAVQTKEDDWKFWCVQSCLDKAQHYFVMCDSYM